VSGEDAEIARRALELLVGERLRGVGEGGVPDLLVFPLDLAFDGRPEELEDLGDDMMVSKLEEGEPREPLYRAAITQLAAMRVRAEATPDPACVAFQRRDIKS